MARILGKLKEKWNISVIVVLDGLKPACVSSEIRTLEKSLNVWKELANGSISSADLFKRILDQYGSRFYDQEIINATKQVEGASFFVAPYLASQQLTYFLKAKLVHSIVGSPNLLSFE